MKIIRVVAITLLITVVVLFAACDSESSSSSYNYEYDDEPIMKYDDGMCERCGEYLGTSSIGDEKVCGGCFEKYLVDIGAATPVNQNGDPVDKDAYLSGYYN